MERRFIEGREDCRRPNEAEKIPELKVFVLPQLLIRKKFGKCKLAMAWENFYHVCLIDVGLMMCLFPKGQGSQDSSRHTIYNH